MLTAILDTNVFIRAALRPRSPSARIVDAYLDGKFQLVLSQAVLQELQKTDGSLIMWDDPIVAEVHRTREKLAAQFNYDVKAFFADLRKRQVALGGRLVRQKDRTEPAAETDRGSSGLPQSTPSDAAPAA